MFYPARTDRKANEYAVALCHSCPLVDTCRDGALARREQFGVWGATTEKQRAAMRRAAA